MAKNNYDIKYLPSFDTELEEILYYITYRLNNKRAAERLLKRIEKSIIERCKNPEGFEKYKSIKNRKYDWYRIYVKNYTIFYIVKNSAIEIAHIVYSRRNIEEII